VQSGRRERDPWLFVGKIVIDIATYAMDPKWAMHLGLVEDRETSLLGALEMHEKWDRKADDRI